MPAEGPQEIIVYQSREEKAIDDFLMQERSATDNAALLLVLVGLLVYLQQRP